MLLAAFLGLIIMAMIIIIFLVPSYFSCIILAHLFSELLSVVCLVYLTGLVSFLSVENKRLFSAIQYHNVCPVADLYVDSTLSKIETQETQKVMVFVCIRCVKLLK